MQENERKCKKIKKNKEIKENVRKSKKTKEN